MNTIKQLFPLLLITLFLTSCSDLDDDLDLDSDSIENYVRVPVTIDFPLNHPLGADGPIGIGIQSAKTIRNVLTVGIADNVVVKVLKANGEEATTLFGDIRVRSDEIVNHNRGPEVRISVDLDPQDTRITIIYNDFNGNLVSRSMERK